MLAGDIEGFSLSIRVARVVSLLVVRKSCLSHRIKKSCAYGISDHLFCILQNVSKICLLENGVIINGSIYRPGYPV